MLFRSNRRHLPISGLVDAPRLRFVESNGAGLPFSRTPETEADCCGCLEEGPDWQQNQLVFTDSSKHRESLRRPVARHCRFRFMSGGGSPLGIPPTLGHTYAISTGSHFAIAQVVALVDDQFVRVRYKFQTDGSGTF